jgi:hypothetical protein
MAAENEDKHNDYCDVFEWNGLIKSTTPNEAKKCTCGYRERRVAQIDKPLNWTDEEFLRSCGIKWEDVW